MIPSLVRPVALLALATAPLAAQRGAQRGASARYVAPTNETIYTSTEMSAGSTPGHVIYVHNRSSVPILVYSAALRDCENVRGSCSPQRLNVKVRPAGREVILRIYARNPDQGFSYRMSFGWRADSASTAALRVLADAGSNDATERLRAQQKYLEEQRQTVGAGDVFLDRDAIATLGDRIAGLRTEPESLVVKEGVVFLLREVRLMALDSAGNRLGRIAGGLTWRLPGTLVIMNRADTIMASMPGRAEVLFRLAPPAKPLEAIFPIIVVPADSVRDVSARTASGRTRGPAAR